MKTSETNAVSIPKDEFDETFATIQELLAQNGDPDDFIIEDPFISSSPIKVDLRKHLKRLHERMSEISKSITPATRMVTIDFN